MIEIIGLMTMVIAVIGVILNNRKCRWCFVLWMVSNSLSAVIHLNTGPWTLVMRDLIFLVLAFDGYWRWR